MKTLGELPLSFEANRGQVEGRGVRFVARGEGYNLFLTDGGAVLDLGRPAGRKARRALAFAGAGAERGEVARAVLRLRLVGGSVKARVSGASELEGKSNYFIGRDPRKWRTGVPLYGKVKYSGVYPGVDAVYRGNQRQLEYDFIVAPGADPKAIVLEFEGADGVETDAEGNLLLSIGGRRVLQRKPFAYQLVGGVARPVAAKYVLKGRNRVAFDVGHYDASEALVIDPVLVYSTYLGGSGDDQGLGVAVDSAGKAYVAGITNSTDFPLTSGSGSTFVGGTDVFVAKLNAAGTGLVYSAYIGGGGDDEGAGVAVDTVGSAYLTGTTESVNFPVTSGVFQTTHAGSDDAFVLKLNTTGSALVYSSLLGGAGGDEGSGVSVDTEGRAYVTGVTDSLNFPTANALQPTKGGGADAFVTKLNVDGSALAYSTFVGGGQTDWGLGVAAGPDGNVYLTGFTDSPDFPTSSGSLQSAPAGVGDGFVVRLNTGSAGAQSRIYSTLIGGGGADGGFGVAADLAGDAFVVGVTHSANFPTTQGALRAAGAGGSDAFVAKLNPQGSRLLYATYLGGLGTDWGFGIAVDPPGNAYVTGFTDSSVFKTGAGDVQAALGGGSDAFVAKLNPQGSALSYLSSLGGVDDEAGLKVSADLAGNAYVAGATRSTNFPTTTGALQTVNGGARRYDSFVAKISDTGPPGPNLSDDASFFVRQHYLDFLNRTPDASGLGFWTGEITQCGSNAQCVEVKRINVSAAFFLSIEFQQTGYLVYRLNKVSFGSMPRYETLLPDTQEIGRGVVVNAQGWEELLESNKRAFVAKWATRPAFKAAYDNKTNEQYVDALFLNAGVTPGTQERLALVDGLNRGAETRATVLRRVAEHPALVSKEFNSAFVLMQYFGYLRRNPDDLPDHDFSGFNFWLGKLNEFNGNFVQAEMVKAFLDSIEYRNRFGR